MNENITLANLQATLDQKYGFKAWVDLQPETILMDYDFPGYLAMEKIYVLKALNANLNHVLSMPEFLLWASNVCNNELADFETIAVPTSLELAFLVAQVKKVGALIGPTFDPTQELTETLAFLLSMDGYSESVPPFEFIPSGKINPEGQPGNPEASSLKVGAIKSYIKHMESIGHA